MARTKISSTRDWELIDSDQDIRGRELWDAHGHKLGTIDDLVVDTDAQRVDSVVLESGDEFRADHLSIAEDAVYVLNYNAAEASPALGRAETRTYEDERVERRPSDSARPYDDGRVQRRAEDARSRDRDRHEGDRRDRDRREEDRLDDDRPARDGVPGFPELSDDFRSHYDSSFRDSNRDYSDWEPAYRYGYDMAFAPAFAGSSFDDVDAELRKGYYQRMGYPMSDRHVWNEVRPAVKHAFQRAREHATA